MSHVDPASIELSSVTTDHIPELDASGSKEVFRSTQSLGLITQRFMSLRQKNEIMNLNDVARELNISKRRVYDVINVLEGLGYVQKTEKNNIQWIGETLKQDECDHLEACVENLRQQEKLLELMISDCQAILGVHLDDPIARSYNYVQKEDIRNTAEPGTKSIIIKSDVDSNSTFDVQITHPSTSGSYDMIVKNKNGVKSHALLFSNEPIIDIKEEEEDEDAQADSEALEAFYGDAGKEWNLDNIPEEYKTEELDPEDLASFILPSTSDNPIDAPYVPETPGRGLFFSPFKSLIDPCILPSYSDDFNNGYIHITTPSRATAESHSEEPSSVMEFFSD